MKKPNKTTDVKKYLQSGILSMPFLKVEEVRDAIMIDFNAKLKMEKDASEIDSLICWIQHFVKYNRNQDFISKNQFSRTAEEIWESGMATGCTDYALLFATFARQLGYSCTLLHTSERGWIQRLIEGGDYKMHFGHTFCECFYNDEWILVDPTCNRIMKKYNPELLRLDYDVVDGLNLYLPYLRNIDMGEKMSTEKFIELQEKLSRKCKI